MDAGKKFTILKNHKTTQGMKAFLKFSLLFLWTFCGVLQLHCFQSKQLNKRGKSFDLCNFKGISKLKNAPITHESSLLDNN